MEYENVEEILACIIKHIRPDGSFSYFQLNEIKGLKKWLTEFCENQLNEEIKEVKPTNDGCGFDEMSDYSLYLNG